MNRLNIILVLIVAITTINTIVIGVVAQTPYVLDKFDVPQATLSLSKSGTLSNYNCGSTSSSLAGGIRKVSITAPSGTNVGFAAQVGVFIPTGTTTAPYGISSTNNNLQSPSFQVLYRLDGDTNICSSGTNVESSVPINKSTKNLNINLPLIGATAFQFSALCGSSPTSVSIIFYSSTGSVMAQSQAIKVSSTSATKSFNTYTLSFLDSTKWTSSSTFSGTVGAIELFWQIASNTHFAINTLQFTSAPSSSTTSVSATVFIDCACNGYQPGSNDSLEANVAVTLTTSGLSCTGSSTQTTGTSGTVIFNNLPTGCTYTLSVGPSINLCSNSASAQTVAAGGTANFAMIGSGVLIIPADKTVICGSDTSPTSTGFATVSGSCSGSTVVSSDVVNRVPCAAPGTTTSIIKRAWTGAGTTLTQTIVIIDSRTIVMQGVPPSTTISCSQVLPPPAQVTVTSCTPATVTTADSTGVVVCDTTTCTTQSTITRTYTAIDQCGNVATSTQKFTRIGCAPSCPPPPPPSSPIAPPPPPTSYPSNINCRFVCDDDDEPAIFFWL